MTIAANILPLVVEHPFGEPGTYIGGKDTSLVCKMLTGDKATDDEMVGLIVRAVNNHDALVQAIEQHIYQERYIHGVPADRLVGLEAALAKAKS